MSWKKVALGKCCAIVSGATPKRQVAEYWGGEIAWATPKDISTLDGSTLDDTPEHISKQGYKSCSARLMPKGSILFSSRAPIGLVAIAGREMCTNQGFKSLVPGPDVDSKYLYHCINRVAPQIADLGNGATFKEVSKRIVSDFEIPLPPLEEQKRIAAILDKADGIRRKRQQALAMADEFLRSVFLDMFGDPVTNPKGWEVKRLDSVAKSYDCPHSTPKWTNEGILCIRTSNLSKGAWDFSERRFVSEKDYISRSSRCEIAGGDIILSREGTIGVAAMVEDDMRLCLGQRLVQIRPKKEIILSTYLLQCILKLTSPKVVAGGMIGTTAQRINLKYLRAIEIPVPGYELQEQYENIHKSTKRMLKRTLLGDHSEVLFSSLASKAFQGKMIS